MKSYGSWVRVPPEGLTFCRSVGRSIAKIKYILQELEYVQQYKIFLGAGYGGSTPPSGTFSPG